MITQLIYDKAAQSFEYMERTVAVSYAVNEFAPFSLGRRVCDGCLLIVVVIFLLCHLIKKAGDVCFIYRCWFDDDRPNSGIASK